MKEKKIKCGFIKRSRRITAGLLTMAMLVTSLPQTVFAGLENGGRDGTHDEDYVKIMEALAAEDSSIAEQYPSGLFSFSTVLCEMNENDEKPMKLYVARHGGTKGEVTLSLKFTDYSAKYGKDYTARVDGGEEVPVNEDNIPYLYMLSDDRTKDLVNQEFEDYDTLVKKMGQEKVDRLQEILENYETTAEEASAEAATADESPLIKLNNQVSQYTNSGINADEVFNTEGTLDPETSTLAFEMMEEIFPGTNAELTFAEGEQIKEIAIYPKNNDVSDGERIFNVVLNDIENVEGTGIDSSNSASITLYDDDEYVASNVYLDNEKNPEAVSKAQGSFDVTISRKDALYNTSSVDFYAVTDNKIVLTSGKVVFMPGVETQDITVNLALAEEASSVNLYVDRSTALGCEASADGLSVNLYDEGNAAATKVMSTKTSSGKYYNADESPIPGFSGTGDYSGFDIEVNDNNFYADSHKTTKCKDTYNKYESDDGGYWHIGMADHGCSCKGALQMCSKNSFSNFYFVDTLNVDWWYRDQEASNCNNMMVITNDSYNLGDSEDRADSVGGIWRFGGDYGRATMTLYNGGSGDGVTSSSGKFKLWDHGSSVMGTQQNSSPAAKLRILAWKTSDCVNAPEIKLYKLHVNYRQFNMRTELPDRIGDDNPGNLYIVTRDSRESSQTDTRYALETIVFDEVAENPNYELAGLMIKQNDGSYKTIGSEYFNPQSMTLKLDSNFYNPSKGYYTENMGTSLSFKPVYAPKKVNVTINTDEHGGITFNGTNYKANSGSRTIQVNAGSTVKFSPYGVEEGYAFSGYTGSETDPDNSMSSWDIEFSQTSEEQSLKIENYNYIITPHYTEDGTFVKINVKGDVPAGCTIPENDFLKLGDGTLKGVGNALAFEASAPDNYQICWKIKTRNHQWESRTFNGPWLDYQVVNGANEIELSFVKKSNASYASVEGNVLKPNGTVRNPSSTGNIPLSNALVTMGRFETFTDSDGNFAFYEREEKVDDNSGNKTFYVNAWPGEWRTVRVSCNNKTTIYPVQISSGFTTSQNLSSPAHAGLTESIKTDFYGNGPHPSKIEVLVGSSNSTPPNTVINTSTVQMSDTTVGFALKLTNLTKDKPVSRVDFKIYDSDMNLREESTYSAVPDEDGNCLLTEYPVYDNGVYQGTMYFNGLLNFHDGDRIFVDIINTTYDGEGNAIDNSYGLYETGIIFKEVPGQDIEVSMPMIALDNSITPTLDIIGNMTPSFNAGPLTVKAVITENSMEFNIGFCVGQFNKSLYQQKVQDSGATIDEEKAKTMTYDDYLEEARKVQQKYMDGELDGDEAAKEMDDLYATYEFAQVDSKLYPSLAADEVDIVEPIADELTNPGKTVQDKAKDMFGKDVSAIQKTIDSLKKAGAGSGSKNKAAAVKDALAQAKGGISLNINLTIGVTVKMVADTQIKSWRFDSALVYAQVGFSIGATFYMTLPSVPVPLYVGFNFTISVGWYNGVQERMYVTLDEMSKDGFDANAAFSYMGKVPIMFGIDAFVGVGIKKLLCLETGVGFIQQFNLAYGDGQSGTGMTTFYGYVSMSLVIFNAQWKYAQKSWDYTLYDSGYTQAMSLASNELNNAVNADLSSLTLDNSEYESVFTGGMKLRSTLEHERTDTIINDVPNVYSDIVPLGDGQYIMLYTGVDNSRPQYNRNAVFYTIYNGSFWSEPKVLQNDGTLDMNLDVEDMGDKILISWSSAEKTYQESDFTDGQTTDKDGNVTVNPDALIRLISSMDVYTIIIDKSNVTDSNLTDSIEKITKDSALELNTEYGYAHENSNAVQLSDGRIILFYSTLDYNTYENAPQVTDLAELLSKPGIMMYRIYENGKWSEDYYASETTYSDSQIKEQLYGQRIADINLQDNEGNTYYPLSGFSDASTINYNGEEKILLTYVIDTDTDFSTSTDRIVCMSIITPPSGEKDSTTSLPLQLCRTGTPVSNPQFSTVKSSFGDINIITWTQGNEFMYFDLTSLFNGTKLSDDDKNLSYDENDESLKYTDEDTIGIEEGTITLENGKTVPYYTLKEGFEANIAIHSDNNCQLNNGYAVDAGRDGNLYVVWAESQGSEQLFRATAMNVIADDEEPDIYTLQWSSPKIMSMKNKNETSDEEDENYEKEYVMCPSVSVDENGDMMLIHNRFDMEADTFTNSEGKELVESSHRANNRLCVAFIKAVGSLCWAEDENSSDTITLSSEYPLAGTTFTATANIENNGLLEAKNISATAKLVTYDKNGNVINTSNPKVGTFDAPNTLYVQRKGTIKAEFDMTQEMIDRAVNDGVTYKVEFTAQEGNYGDEAISASADVKVGSRLEFVEYDVKSSRTRALDLTNFEEAGPYDGMNRYIIKSTLINTGNVASKQPDILVQMENKNAFVTAGLDDTELNAEELQQYMENSALNSSIVNDENFKPYFDVGGTIAQQIETIEPGGSTPLIITTKKIPDEAFSDKGLGSFMITTSDENSFDGETSDFIDITATVADFWSPRVRLNGEIVYDITMREGDTLDLEGGSVQADRGFSEERKVIFASENEEIATVDENGKVTAVSEGETVIIATSASDTTEVKVTVTGTDTAPDAIISGEQGQNGWFISDITLTAPEGFEIALDQNDWKDSLVITEDGTYEITYYLRDSKGRIYEKKVTVKKDSTPPVISGIEDGKTYIGPQSVTVTDDNLDIVNVNDATVTLENGTFTLNAAEGSQTVTAIDKAGNQTKVTVAINSENASTEPPTDNNNETPSAGNGTDGQVSSDNRNNNNKTATAGATGDEANLGLWLALMLISGGTIGIISCRKKRNTCRKSGS